MKRKGQPAPSIQQKVQKEMDSDEDVVSENVAKEIWGSSDEEEPILTNDQIREGIDRILQLPEENISIKGNYYWSRYEVYFVLLNG